MSIKQDDALTVLLTGRAEHSFADIIKRIVSSKNLIFDMICLKPRAGPSSQKFTSTMKFKQAILEDLVHTYKDANEIRIYEDRPGHTQAFREYFEDFNNALMSPNAPTPRKRINAEIIQVADTVTTLDPVTETTEIQRMLNDHNVTIRTQNPLHLLPYEIKRTVFFTGYLLSPQDSLRLSDLVDLPRKSESGITFLANSILISARPPSASLLRQVGGLGHKQKWQVTGIGHHQSGQARIWAARVAPVPAHSSIYTESSPLLVVLALTREARPADANSIRDWRPIGKEEAHIFESTVGEKVQLRIQQEDVDHEFDWSYHDLKRPHGQENDRPARDRPFRQPRGGYNNNSNNNDENRKSNGQSNNRYDGNRDRNYNEGPGHPGNDGYKASFPALGGGDGAADGGLSY
ncbi:MAG: hypothetical protein Q9195_000384 [Heterodermia aff. obscurata]